MSAEILEQLRSIRDPAYEQIAFYAAQRIDDLQAMASEMISAIPGGSICDPQQISDALREIAAKYGVKIR